MSALVNKIYTLGNFVSFTDAGLNIASYVDIKKTLITRFKQLYGEDIDVSDASVDGQYVSELALLINNILQALNTLYQNLDPSTASGHALDVLASFSNISRKPATASTCVVNATYQGFLPPPSYTATVNIPVDTKFIDKNGLIWNIDESRSSYLTLVGTNYEFKYTENALTLPIPLICSELGPNAIEANTIDGFAIMNPELIDINISQPTDGIKGTVEESDSHLRARRNSSAANEAVTVLESLKGSLLNNTLIVDAQILNHLTDIKDDQQQIIIPAHTVEVLVRRDNPTEAKQSSDAETSANTDAVDTFIKETIYQKMTPGIPTIFDASIKDDEDNPRNIEKSYIKEIVPGTQTFDETITWTYCKPLTKNELKLSINLNSLANFDKTTTINNLITNINTYASQLEIMKDMTATELLQVVLQSDPKYQGISTFYCTPNDIKFDNVAFTGSIPSECSANENKTYYSDVIEKIYVDGVQVYPE